MTELLIAILAMQMIIFVVVLIGTNFLDRAWQLGIGGYLFSRLVKKFLKGQR